MPRRPEPAPPGLMTKEQILRHVAHLKVDRHTGRRAPYKPLLLLLAIAKLQEGVRQLRYSDVEESLKQIFFHFAPPIKNAQEPRLPYWHLQSDKLWEVSNAEHLPKRKGGFPKMDGLRATQGMLADSVQKALEADEAFAGQVVQVLLDAHFPPSLHQELSERIGFTMPYIVVDSKMLLRKVRQREAKFRHKVLQAYEHRCAVTGFSAELDGVPAVCQAAHIKWHGQKGPDTVNNGLALEPSLHELFDRGAWTLTDDRKILVSKRFSGNVEAERRLLSHHGKPIKVPLYEADLPSIAFIKWHREPRLGGVFREPALPL